MRTGNLMFQIAHAYSKSLDYNRQFILPKYEFSNHLEDTLFRKLDFNLTEVPSDTESVHITSKFEYNTDLVPDNERPTVYHGYYQSEKFFINHSETIKDLFSPTKDFIDRVTKDYPFLMDSVVVSINVRRGDYLNKLEAHPVITKDYIEYAMRIIPRHHHIIVTTDDIKWCKDVIKLPNIHYNEKYTDHEGLWLMSLCKHFIISNSSYSWWGAYLSRNKNKMVITPDTWFGPEITVKTDDIYCENWIKIPTKWDRGRLELRK